MSSENPSALTNWSAATVFAIVLGYWLYTVSLRIGYPYDLEWMEGGMLIHALRIQEGLGIYVPPSSDFIPYIYPPLYPTFLSVASELWTLDYWMGRGLSIVGTLLATSALVFGLRKETGSWAMGWLSGALWLSSYDDVGTFFDLTRADGLMMGVLAWSIVCARWNRLVVAGLLCWVAFLTKHNAAIVGVPIALWLWRTASWQSALRFGLWSAVPALMSIGWLQWSTDGLFLIYLLDVPAHHPIVGQRLVWLSAVEMLTPFVAPTLLLSVLLVKDLFHRARWRGIVLGLAVLAFVGMTQVDVSAFPKIAGSHKAGQIPFAVAIWILVVVACARPSVWLQWWRNGQEDEQGSVFWRLIACTLFLFSALMRGHHGGFTNVLMPGIWSLCVVVPLLIHRYGRQYPTWLIHIGMLLMMGQSVWGLWAVEDYAPTEEDRLAGDAMVAEFSSSQGPVWAPHSPWLSVQAGYEPTTHLIALWDIDHEGGPLVDYVDDIKSDIANHRWGTIVSADKRLGFGVRQHYEYHRSIRPKGRLFVPKVGWKVRPSYVYRPKKTAVED